MIKRNLLATGALLVLLASCSSDNAPAASAAPTVPGTTGSTAVSGPPVDLSAKCEAGDWVSTSMDVPSQAGIGEITPTGGGDGMNITFAPDGVFQIDFGPMQPAIGTFTSGGQAASLSTTFSGVGKGTWSVDAQDVATATFADFTTAKATVVITLGQTVPPVFDETLQQLNDQRMLNGEKVGVFTVTECSADALSMTTPFPAGSITIHAAPKG
ncbi:MAG: hypothetical protein RJA49_2460 [Actinomycetota bacterium]